MYTIVNSEPRDVESRIENGSEHIIEMRRVDIVVDSEGDIPKPLEDWTAGSMVLSADTKEFKVLNNSRVWV